MQTLAWATRVLKCLETFQILTIVLGIDSSRSEFGVQSDGVLIFGISTPEYGHLASDER